MARTRPRTRSRSSAGSSEPALLAAALALREQVFVGEQGVPAQEELDGRDGEALHLVALAHSLADGPRNPALAARGGGRENRPRRGGARVSQARHRREHAGALAKARERGARRARLAAQIEALALYEHAGFAVDSAPFQEAGIEHVWMGREL